MQLWILLTPNFWAVEYVNNSSLVSTLIFKVISFLQVPQHCQVIFPQSTWSATAVRCHVWEQLPECSWMGGTDSGTVRNFTDFYISLVFVVWILSLPLTGVNGWGHPYVCNREQGGFESREAKGKLCELFPWGKACYGESRVPDLCGKIIMTITLSILMAAAHDRLIMPCSVKQVLKRGRTSSRPFYI